MVIGFLAVPIGMLPAHFIQKLHHRDFIPSQSQNSLHWQRQLRLWHLEDRLVYTCSYALSGLCFFYQLVFVANVTAEGGLAWLIACSAAMLLVSFGPPLAVALCALLALTVTPLSKNAQREARLLCLVGDQPSKTKPGYSSSSSHEGGGASTGGGHGIPDSGYASTWHRPPKSQWNSIAKRRTERLRATALAQQRANFQFEWEGTGTLTTISTVLPEEFTLPVLEDSPAPCGYGAPSWPLSCGVLSHSHASNERTAQTEVSAWRQRSIVSSLRSTGSPGSDETWSNSSGGIISKLANDAHLQPPT